MKGFFSGRRHAVVITFAVMVFIARGTPGVRGAERLLTLEQAIEIALEDGFEMKSLHLQIIQAEENRRAAKYRFRSSAEMTLSAPTWSENVSAIQVPNGLPIYNRLGTLRYQTVLNINQPLPTDGRITFRSQLYKSEETNYLAETNETLKRMDFLSSMRIYMTQPLLTYNRLKTGLREAELNYERTSLSSTRNRLTIIYEITNSFYTLYNATRRHEIARETFEQQEQAYELARLKYEAGLIPEVEALRMEVNLASARSGLFDAEANLASQKEAFKLDLGLDIGDEIGAKTDIVYSHFDIDLDTAVEKGLEHRTEIREREIAIELNRIGIERIDSDNEVRADLTAFFDLTGYSDPNLPFGTQSNDLFDSSWEDLKRRPGNRGVTLTFSLPIWDWGVNKAQVASARADLKRNELSLKEDHKRIINSITDAVRRVQSAENSLVVLQKSQEVAQRTYDISLERFNNGEITSQDLALDNKSLSEAKMSFLGAYISYKLAVEDLKRKTMWDFENNQTVE